MAAVHNLILNDRSIERKQNLRSRVVVLRLNHAIQR
jgi:hypothetical protein